MVTILSCFTETDILVLEPIPTKGLGPADVDALTHRVEKLMFEEMKRVTEQWWGSLGYKPPADAKLPEKLTFQVSTDNKATNGAAKATGVQVAA
jgi:hypothetical protein